MNRGPLADVRVIELGGIGPGPHTGMILADLGADVVRVRRPGGLQMPAEDADLLHRGKRVVDLDLKTDAATLMHTFGCLANIIKASEAELSGFNKAASNLRPEARHAPHGAARPRVSARASAGRRAGRAR